MEQKMTWKESLEMYFAEYMAGGFGEKWVKPEVKALFSDVEGLLTEDKEIPDELAERWEALFSEGIYL